MLLPEMNGKQTAKSARAATLPDLDATPIDSSYSGTSFSVGPTPIEAHHLLDITHGASRILWGSVSSDLLDVLVQ